MKNDRRNAPNGATATHLVTFLIFGSFLPRNDGKRGVGVVFPSPSGPGGAPFGETLTRNPTFGISKPFGTRRGALRGNPHQKSDFWDFQALLLLVLVLVLVLSLSVPRAPKSSPGTRLKV